MGQVYLAHDTRLDRDVALKVMVGNIADDPELKQRFEREAKAVARMTHPNVVTVFDFDYHTDGSPYIAMELLKGQDLHKAVRQPPAMTVERKVAIIVQVLAGLAHAHQAGIVHRDIKPANIFINEDGSVKIMDFGVARLTAGSMTGTGNIVGTADYMSPEQVKGAKVDGRSDLFSVGCMLYELLASKRPFHSDNLMAIFYKITHEEANFDLIPQGPEYDALLPILKRAMSKDLAQRYQTAYDFAIDLRTWLQAHASSDSSQNVLEALVDLEAPTHPPVPLDSTGPNFLPVDGGGEERWISAAGAGRGRVLSPGGRSLAHRRRALHALGHAGRGAHPRRGRHRVRRNAGDSATGHHPARRRGLAHRRAARTLRATAGTHILPSRPVRSTWRDGSDAPGPGWLHLLAAAAVPPCPADDDRRRAALPRFPRRPSPPRRRPPPPRRPRSRKRRGSRPPP